MTWNKLYKKHYYITNKTLKKCHLVETSTISLSYVDGYLYIQFKHFKDATFLDIDPVTRYVCSLKEVCYKESSVTSITMRYRLWWTLFPFYATFSKIKLQQLLQPQSAINIGKKTGEEKGRIEEKYFSIQFEHNLNQHYRDPAWN